MSRFKFRVKQTVDTVDQSHLQIITPLAICSNILINLFVNQQKNNWKFLQTLDLNVMWHENMHLWLICQQLSQLVFNY